MWVSEYGAAKIRSSADPFWPPSCFHTILTSTGVVTLSRAEKQKNKHNVPGQVGAVHMTSTALHQPWYVAQHNQVTDEVFLWNALFSFPRSAILNPQDPIFGFTTQQTIFFTTFWLVILNKQEAGRLQCSWCSPCSPAMHAIVSPLHRWNHDD